MKDVQNMAETSLDLTTKPTKEISVREVFGIDTDMVVHGSGQHL